MIAAGSLFTSCVENTEPQGIKDLRLAKADYLDALSNLRAADAEKVKAEAALQQAYADVQKAIAAQNQALAEAQKLANEAAALDNEKKAEQIAADIDSIKAAAEKAAVKAEQDLAQAQWDLEVALRKIVAESFTLTAAEDSVIKASADSLLAAQKAYNKEVKKLNNLNQQLWIAEYDHAAGYDTLRADKRQLSENYQDSIANREDAIARHEATIATYEAVKEYPEKAKDFIDEYKKENKEAQEDSLSAWSAQNLYEVTKLVEANKAYKEKVDAFKKDSVGTKPAYLFATITEKKDTVKVEYPLTNGKGLDAKFKAYVNEAIKINGKTAADHGIEVGKNADDKWNILVGGKDVKKENLDTAQAIVATIVEALNRDLVVVNDSTAAKDYEDFVKAAKIADSTYKAHRSILEKGLDSFKVYTLAKDTVKMFQDTVKVADSLYKVAAQQAKNDSAAVVTGVKTAAANYIKANKDFVYIVNKFIEKERNTDKIDSAAFIKAIQDLGKAKAAFFGKEDSLKQYTLNNNKLDSIYLPFSELESDGFVAKKNGVYPGDGTYTETSLYGGTGYGAFADLGFASELKDKAYYVRPDGNGHYILDPDAFARVVRIVTQKPAWAWATITPADIAVDIENDYKYNEASKVAYKRPTSDLQDSVKFAEKYTKIAELAALAESKAAETTAKEDVETAKNKLEAKEANVGTAKTDYLNIVKSFWGRTATVDADTAAYKFNWTDKTFFEPENCVVFSYSDPERPDWNRHIIDNNELRIALEGVDKEFVYENGGVDYGSKIFWGGDKDGRNGTRTEFALAIFAKQFADDAANYEFLEDQLANINEQVAAIKADVAAYNEEYAVADKAYNTALKALTGKDDGTGEVAELKYANVDKAKGVWDLKGKQLEFANEVAPEYPVLVKAFQDCKKKAEEIVAENNAVITKLEDVCKEWAKLETPEGVAQGTSIATIIENLNTAIGDQRTKISNAKKDIAVFEKAIAMVEQGYDAYSVAVTALKQRIANAEEAVARAEAILKIRKAEYEAVIAQYGVNE